MTFRRFVALGDSFTEGLDDLGEDGSPRGWADLVAAGLAAANPRVEYANLAVRSRQLVAVLSEQVPAALAMTPDLVSIAAGGNDILGFRFDADRVARGMVEAIETLAGSGATVVVFAGFDPRPRLPMGAMLAGRAEAFNQVLRRTAVEQGAVLVDLWAMAELRDPRMWSPDRLHFSTLGHRQIAGAVLVALGLPPPTGWPVALGSTAPLTRLGAALDRARWTRTHFVPWLVRKARGHSMGDGRSAKRPALSPVQPPTDGRRSVDQDHPFV